MEKIIMIIPCVIMTIISVIMMIKTHHLVFGQNDKEINDEKRK